MVGSDLNYIFGCETYELHFCTTRLYIKGIYLSKALTCMKIFLYKQILLLCQGYGYLLPHRFV